jgi:uncharacterized membrane protein YeiB
MDIFALIIFYGFFGLIINEMAKSRNRDQASWVILSLLISPLLGIIALLFVGNNKEEKEKTE